MDINILREAVTVASFLAFLGIVAFAAFPGNEGRFREAANLPLVDDEAFEAGPSPEPSPKGEGPKVGGVFSNQGHR